MQAKDITRLATAAGPVLAGSSAMAAKGKAAKEADAPKGPPATLDSAFETMKTYDWGMDRSLVSPIDDAVVASLSDAAARKALETRLAAAIKGESTRDAKDVMCRALRVIGTAECVPTLAALLADKDLSHMARYALERIQAPEAGAALCDALPKVSGALKVGVIGSLGARCDAACEPALIGLLGDSDAEIVIATATALGEIGTPKAATAMVAAAEKAPAAAKPAVIDGALQAADKLAAAGNKTDAMAVYKAFSKSEIKHVKLAAMRGLLAATGK